MGGLSVKFSEFIENRIVFSPRKAGGMGPQPVDRAALRSTVDARTEHHQSFAGVWARQRCKGTELTAAAEKDRGRRSCRSLPWALVTRAMAG
jgi:hypothetical protein